MPLLFLFIILLSIFHIVIPLSYYLTMKRVAERKPWGLNIKRDYSPSVTIMVPTFNEASTIIRKLQNLEELSYPKDKLRIVIVDSASTDETAEIAERYIKNSEFPIKTLVLKQEERKGKAAALNFALQYGTEDIVATSDADCLWNSESLSNAVAYLYDRSIAAVCGKEELMKPNLTSATRTESQYRGIFNPIRIGEAKMQSSIIFEGALALYKRNLLHEFDALCDDSGTALDLVQKGYRVVTIPNAVFVNPFPSSWKGKIIVKTRRAQHLVEIWFRCFKLDVARSLKLRPIIARMNFFLYIVNPFLFLAFILTSGIMFLQYPFLFLMIPLVLIIPQLRRSMVLYVSTYSILLYAIFREALGKKQIIWEKGR